jgi:hypothetical protein
MLPVIGFAALVGVTLFNHFRPDRFEMAERLDGRMESVRIPRSRHQPIKWTVIGIVLFAWVAILVVEQISP